MFALLMWLGILAALLFYYVAVQPLSYWKKRGVLQGKPRWFFGDQLAVLLRRKTLPDLINELYKRFPNVRYHGVYEFYKPILLIRDPALVKQITVKAFEHFTDRRTVISENVDPVFGKTLFSLKGKKWREMRPILSPIFTSSKMRSMFVLISECSQDFVKHLLKGSNQIVDVDMKDVLKRYGNDVIATTAFGIKIDSLAEPENDFFMNVKELTNFNTIRIVKFFVCLLAPKLCEIFQISPFGGKMRKFFVDLVENSIRQREENIITRPDMIHVLVEARRGKLKNEDKEVIDTGFATVEEADIGPGSKPKDITNLDIAAHAMIFFVAGFDGVTTQMSFMAQELAVNADIQDRLRKEVDATAKKCEGKLTYEALMKMRYMDMVVSESLRRWPIAMVTDRTCTKPITIEPTTSGEKQLLIEEGTVISIPIYGFHMDPKYYHDPEKFDPERFNDENKAKIHPYAFMPFGLGPRNCVGSRFALLEIKILFFHLLLNFEIVPTEKTTIPWKLAKSLQLSIEGGFNLGLKRIVR